MLLVGVGKQENATNAISRRALRCLTLYRFSFQLLQGIRTLITETERERERERERENEREREGDKERRGLLILHFWSQLLRSQWHILLVLRFTRYTTLLKSILLRNPFFFYISIRLFDRVFNLNDNARLLKTISQQDMSWDPLDRFFALFTIQWRYFAIIDIHIYFFFLHYISLVFNLRIL